MMMIVASIMAIIIVTIPMTTCIYSSSMAGSLVVGRANSVNQTFLPHLIVVVLTIMMTTLMTAMVIMIWLTSDKWC